MEKTLSPSSLRGVTLQSYFQQQQTEDRLLNRSLKVNTSTEPLYTLVTRGAALKCRDLVRDAISELPEDPEALWQDPVAMSKAKRQNNLPGTMLRDGASMQQVVRILVLRTLERFVRVLKPFGFSGPALSVLIARLVHEEFERTNAKTQAAQVIEIVPPDTNLLGAGFRRVVPRPQRLALEPWPFIEDMSSAMDLEEQFSQNPGHPLRPSSEAGGARNQNQCKMDAREAARRAGTSIARPKSVGDLQTISPKGASAKLRLSSRWPWADFQSTTPSRATNATVCSERYIRGSPGPDIYGDLGQHFTAPQRASWGRFSPAGDRRTQCCSTPLSQRGRFFDSDYVIAS